MAEARKNGQVSQHPYEWWATKHLEKLDKIIVNSGKIKKSNDTKSREKGVEVITKIQQPTLPSDAATPP